MKKIKIISLITTVFMIISTLSSFMVNAEETEEKLYTLEELFAMSDDEFFALKGADILYEFPCDDTCCSGSIFRMDVLGKDYYIPNVTETEIKKLLGDTVEYDMSSPIEFDKHDLYFQVMFSVWFPEFNCQLDETEKIIKFAKCWYCVDQVISLDYYWNNIDLSVEPSNEKIITGDVNLDKTVDLYDVVWIAKHLINVFELTEGQQAVGDINEDGKTDLYDAIGIAKTLIE